MAACRHRPEDGCLFVGCHTTVRDSEGKRVCLCADEVRADIEAEAALDAACRQRFQEFINETRESL
jgi:hypothetical protein